MNVMRAAIVGDVETVKQWLTAPHISHHLHVAQVLVQAAQYGHDNICQLMLDSGQVPDGVISQALNAACRHNQQSTAQLLLRHGHINTHDLTDVLVAARNNGHIGIVKWLISDVMQLSQLGRIKWLLTTACARGDLSVVKQLAAHVDSDVTRVMSQALRVACHNGRDDVVKWLMSHTTADASSRGFIDKELGEMTSLMAACFTGYSSTVRQLMQCVTPHALNMMSGGVANTALHLTICYEPDKNSRMHIACANSDIATVTTELYLSNVDLQICMSLTALHYACARGNVDIVRMLLSVFANTQITEDERRTPAMVAELHGHTELLPYLRGTLSDSSDISAQNNNISSSVSVKDVTQHNTRHTNSRRPATNSKQTKRSSKRIV